MDSHRSGVLLTFGVIASVILAGVAGVGWFLFRPHRQQSLVDATGSGETAREVLKIGEDNFAGYAILRSDAVALDLKGQGIRLEHRDDAADTPGRIRALAAGELDLAVFTVDSYLTAGATFGSFPGSIVQVIDESRGADGVVARRSVVPTIDALNRADGRIVGTGASPSEYLARLMRADMDLDQLPAEGWFVPTTTVDEAFARFTKETGPVAFVLWEPFLSRAAAAPDAVVLLDTSRVRGLVDVLVARREVLAERPEAVRAVVSATLAEAARCRREPGRAEAMVQADAQRTGAPTLDAELSQRVVKGIAWQGAQENYARFGLLTAEQAAGLPGMEELVVRTVETLVRTRGLATDPLAGAYGQVFHSSSVLAVLQAEGVHRPGVGGGDGDDPIDAGATLRALSMAEWASLTTVGSARVDPIVFARGSDQLLPQGRARLDGLVRSLRFWPTVYVTVQGNARADGDMDANRRLAQGRADAVLRYLGSAGVNPNRLRATAAVPSALTSAAQTVSFRLGQEAW